MPCLKLPCFQELCSAWRGSSSSVSTQRTAMISNRPTATSHCIPSIHPRTLHSSRTLLGLKLHPQHVKDMMPRPHRNNCCWEGVVFFEERGLPSRTVFSFSSSNCSSGIARQSGLPATGTVGTMENAKKGSKPSGSQDPVLEEVEEALGSALGVGPQAPPQRPLVMVVSGPSGVGKDAVIKRLQEVRKDIHFVVTATTRPKRPGEIHGKDYFFVTKEQFETMIEKDELLEYAVVYGDYKGIPKEQVRECLKKGLDVVLRVDVQGAATVRSILGSGAVFIFLVAESEAALVKRLMERKTETRDKLLLRVATARGELKRMEEFDYVVVNADQELEKSVSTVCHIIDAEKARVHQREACL